MATLRTGLTSEGALYEAVARGNKDTFFFTDDVDKAINPFENRYEPVPPVVHELRRVPPLNGAAFGRSCEFEFEIAGDMFVAPTILIDLPSWLPPAEAALNPTTTITETGTGRSYGYVNGIGYFLFSKIQIYQDKLLLNEFSGDALWMSRASRGSLSSAYLENRLAGWHDGSAASIGAAATPGRLRLELPFIGGPVRGFPSIAMRHQNFKVRLELRPLERVVESSVATATTAPKPWEAASFTVAAPAPVGTYTVKPLARTAMDDPTLQLETRHVYTDGETQLSLRSKNTLELPFSQLNENVFTFAPLDYAPLERAAAAQVKKRLEGRHPASRLVWVVRSQDDLRAGRRWKVAADNSGQEYTNTASLIIAGRDRETAAGPLVWRDLIHHAKEERDPGIGFGEMNWDLGDQRGRRAPLLERQPEGSINFTTADRPTLYVDLAAVPADSVAGKPSTEMTAIVDAWALYSIEGDRGVLKYGN